MSLIAKLATPDTKEKWLGYYQALWGIGAMTGPLIGSALYELLGFEYTFYVYGAAEILLGIVVWFKVRNSPLMQESDRQRESLVNRTSVIDEVSRESNIAIQAEAFRASTRTDNQALS